MLVVEDREFGELRQRVTAFGEEIKKCSGCKAVGSVDITLGTMVQRLPGLISLSSAPIPILITSLFPTTPRPSLSAKACARRGERGKVKIAGYEGDPQTIDAIHNGTQAATIADPAEWMGWQAIDELNRSFAGGPAQNTPVVFKLIDKSNAPDTKGWSAITTSKPSIANCGALSNPTDACPFSNCVTCTKITGAPTPSPAWTLRCNAPKSTLCLAATAPANRR